MRRSLAIVPLLIALAVLASTLPVAARSPIALGVSDPLGSDLGVLDAHIAAAGVKPSLWSLWSNWGDRGGNVDCVPGVGSCGFPTATVKALHARGIDPVIWWQPSGPGRPTGRYESYRRILSGAHDAYIVQWARDAKAAGQAHPGRRIILRFAHEAVGHWFPWSIGKFGNTGKNYKKAWKYIYAKFKAVGATKYVRFMWSHVYPYAWAYPGDRYVDYVGITVMNWGGADRKWKTMARIANPRIANARKFSRKPIVLAEVGTNFVGGNKARWIRDGYMTMFRKQPRVKAIMYLDTDKPHIVSGGDQPDWRLAVPDSSGLAAYRSVANKGKFKGRLW